MGCSGRGKRGGLCRGEWVTDRRPRRELGSQRVAGVAGQQAAVIRIIRRAAARSLAHRQILIGKISWDELKQSCALSYSSVISLTLGQLPEKKFTLWVCVCCSMSQSCMCKRACTNIRHRREIAQPRKWKDSHFHIMPLDCIATSFIYLFSHANTQTHTHTVRQVHSCSPAPVAGTHYLKAKGKPSRCGTSPVWRHLQASCSLGRAQKVARGHSPAGNPGKMSSFLPQ